MDISRHHQGIAATHLRLSETCDNETENTSDTLRLFEKANMQSHQKRDV